MPCKNHPESSAAAHCAGCAESFCENCLVEIQGENYCASCKVLALKGRTIAFEEGTVPCKEAGEALTFAIISIFCFGIILGPVAIVKAHKAKQLIDADPQLTGRGKAATAQVIGAASFFFILGVISQIQDAGSM